MDWDGDSKHLAYKIRPFGMKKVAMRSIAFGRQDLQ
jgi:hypothetical protein